MLNKYGKILAKRACLLSMLFAGPLFAAAHNFEAGVKRPSDQEGSSSAKRSKVTSAIAQVGEVEKSVDPENYLDKLPNELVDHIAELADPQSLGRLGQVSHRLNVITKARLDKAIVDLATYCENPRNKSVTFAQLKQEITPLMYQRFLYDLAKKCSEKAGDATTALAKIIAQLNSSDNLDLMMTLIKKFGANMNDAILMSRDLGANNDLLNAITYSKRDNDIYKYLIYRR